MLFRLQMAIEVLRMTLLRHALLAIACMLIPGHLAGQAACLLPALATGETSESESSESPDETTDTTPTAAAERPTIGVRLFAAKERQDRVGVRLRLQGTGRQTSVANLSPLGIRDRLNGCGAVLRC